MSRRFWERALHVCNVLCQNRAKRSPKGVDSIDRRFAPTEAAQGNHRMFRGREHPLNEKLTCKIK